MTRFLILPVLLAGWLACAPQAHAQLEPGEAAPPLKATAFVNTRPLTLGRLRGRVVLLEFFSTRCTHCKRHAAQLQALHTRYATRGLTVLAVTRDDATKCRAFAREQGARYPIAVAGLDAQRAYLVQRYPEGCLLSAFGEVLWSGYAPRLPESEIRAALTRARPQPVYTRAQRWIDDGIAEGRYAETRRRLARFVRCRPVDEGCAALRSAYGWIDWYARERRAQATELEVLGRPYAAWRALDELRRSFAGAPESLAAAAASKRLLADEARRREVAAGEALTAVIGRARALLSKHAAAAYEDVARRHTGTRAAARALRKADLLRKKKR